MDTITHTLVGASIGLIASNIPALQDSTNIIVPIAIVSSLIPDIDVLTKPFKNENYLKAHRGITHTIPVILLLAFIAPLLSLIITKDIPFYALYIISLISIFSHFFLDIMNPYGTLMIPKSDLKRVGSIYTFDPIFLSLLILSIIMFKVLFLSIMFFIACFLYLSIRHISLVILKNKYKEKYPDSINVFIMSKINPLCWNVVIELEDKFIVAKFEPIHTIDRIEEKKVTLDNKYKDIIKDSKVYKSFLRLAYCYNINIKENNDEVIITLYDLKYRKKEFYYFRALFRIKDSKLVNSYVGYIFSDEEFMKKLNKNSN